jgi:hypothetical protein
MSNPRIFSADILHAGTADVEVRPGAARRAVTSSPPGALASEVVMVSIALSALSALSERARLLMRYGDVSESVSQRVSAWFARPTREFRKRYYPRRIERITAKPTSACPLDVVHLRAPIAC